MFRAADYIRRERRYLGLSLEDLLSIGFNLLLFNGVFYLLYTLHVLIM